MSVLPALCLSGLVQGHVTLVNQNVVQKDNLADTGKIMNINSNALNVSLVIQSE